MKNKLLGRSDDHADIIFFATVATIALASVYLIYRRKNRFEPTEVPNLFYQDTQAMERYVFSLYHEDKPIQAIVEQGGECYAVHLNGEYAGNLWQDEANDSQWRSQDEGLKPFVSDISEKLSQVYSRSGFGAILMGTYPEIVATDWKSSETLEVILNQETDIEVFGTFLKDEVSNLVSFEEHLDLIVRKVEDAYFVLIGVN